ncbi:MAG: DUF4147 domain-containing protein [Acetobacteraceae bacterium]|nr:DUF4147 domain-containing protein [Acetobacteraceae bacterium]
MLGRRPSAERGPGARPPHGGREPRLRRAEAGAGGRTVVAGADKASAAMVRAVEDHWDGPLEGLVVARYGHGIPCRRVEIVRGVHPVRVREARDVLEVCGCARGAALRAGDVIAMTTGTPWTTNLLNIVHV